MPNVLGNVFSAASQGKGPVFCCCVLEPKLPRLWGSDMWHFMGGGAHDDPWQGLFSTSYVGLGGACSSPRPPHANGMICSRWAPVLGSNVLRLTACKGGPAWYHEAKSLVSGVVRRRLVSRRVCVNSLPTFYVVYNRVTHGAIH